MIVKRYTEDIIIYENFISDNECRNIINLLDYKVENGTMTWTPISFYESYSSNLPQDNDVDLKSFNLSNTFFSETEKRIINAVASVHNLKSESIYKIGYHTQKWEPGSYARPHSDNTDMDGSASPFERSRYAAFLYLNDDFEGGMLRFTKQDVEIKPKIGMLVAFHGGFRNIHEVTLITKGVRYTLGSFWDDKDESDYPEDLRNKWKEDMQKIRDNQKIEKEEWKKTLEQGYKISEDGKKYKIEDLIKNETC
jgi:hypothetical protein